MHNGFKQLLQRRLAVGLIALSVGLVALPRHAAAVETGATAERNKPAYLKDVGIDQKLGAQVPLDLTFRDESGQPVQLAKYFDGHKKPVILTLVYYSCPQLCTLVLNDLNRGLNGLSTLSAGDDFQVVTVSIDPSDTSALAADKKATYMASYRRPHADQGWHFLTGDQTSIRRLAQAVGFKYKWDPKFQQFIHPSGLIILTPKGTISRYFFGIDYDTKDLRLSLEEASSDKIGSFTDRILLYCFHYDESSGRYTPTITRILKLGGVLTMAALGFFWFAMYRFEQARYGGGGPATDEGGPAAGGDGPDKPDGSDGQR
jgi:protein SCO1/2